MNFKLFILCCIVHSIVAAKIPEDEVGHLPLAPRLSPRIVGGVDAEEVQAPFQCSLQRNRAHFCGCAIISSKFILTAAHCLTDKPAEEIDIVVGTNKRISGGTIYKIQKTIINENYNDPERANDIALIQVKGEIEFNEKVQPIKLISKNLPEKSEVQAYGFGQLIPNDAFSTELQVINLKTLDYYRCVRDFKHHVSHLCTETAVYKGVCDGDDGGPLVFENELVGIANFYTSCASGTPDVFANIAYFYDWIQQNIRA